MYCRVFSSRGGKVVAAQKGAGAWGGTFDFWITPSSKSSFWFQKTPSQDPLRGSQAHVHHTSHSTSHDTKLTDNAGTCVLQACVKILILHARARALKSDSGPRGTGLARSHGRIWYRVSHSHTRSDAASNRLSRTTNHARAASGPHWCSPSAPSRSRPCVAGLHERCGRGDQHGEPARGGQESDAEARRQHNAARIQLRLRALAREHECLAACWLQPQKRARAVPRRQAALIMRCARTCGIDAHGCRTPSPALSRRASSRSVPWTAQSTRARGPPPPLVSVFW